jgi:hypothetical protein
MCASKSALYPVAAPNSRTLWQGSALIDNNYGGQITKRYLTQLAIARRVS